jgi:hypothetical protein
MSYSIVFSGELKPTVTREQAISNLAILFKKDENDIAKLFSAKRVLIRRDLSQQEATKYQLALANAGIVTELLIQNDTATPATPPSNTDKIEVANTVKSQVENVEIKPASIDISSLSMAEPGTVIMEHEHILADTVVPPNLEIAPPGSTISQEKPVQEPDIDISSISMADAGETITGKNK